MTRRMSGGWLKWLGGLIVVVLVAGCAPPPTSPISAFFGLDDALPPNTAAICPEAPGLDGMPVVLGSEINSATLEPSDFAIVRASGAEVSPACTTLLPSIDPGELRTVLLIGQFGSDDDPPITVRVVDELRTIDNTGDFQGSDVAVIPLADGPSMVLAAEPTAAERQASASQEPAGNCVADPALSVIRVTWDGGITLPGGDAPGTADLDIYTITAMTAKGEMVNVNPVGFADVADSDNVHELCLPGDLVPLAVSVMAGRLDDPRGDLNPFTTIGLSYYPPQS